MVESVDPYRTNLNLNKISNNHLIRNKGNCIDEQQYGQKPLKHCFSNSSSSYNNAVFKCVNNNSNNPEQLDKRHIGKFQTNCFDTLTTTRGDLNKKITASSKKTCQAYVETAPVSLNHSIDRKVYNQNYQQTGIDTFSKYGIRLVNNQAGDHKQVITSDNTEQSHKTYHMKHHSLRQENSNNEDNEVQNEFFNHTQRKSVPPLNKLNFHKILTNLGNRNSTTRRDSFMNSTTRKLVPPPKDSYRNNQHHNDNTHHESIQNSNRNSVRKSYNGLSSDRQTKQHIKSFISSNDSTQFNRSALSEKETLLSMMLHETDDYDTIQRKINLVQFLQNLKQKKIKRTNKYIEPPNDIYQTKWGFISGNEDQKYTQSNVNQKPTINGMPVSYELLENLDITKEIDLPRNTYNLMTFHVNNFVGVLKVSQLQLAHVEFYISSKFLNPDKANCDQYITSTESFTIHYQNWNFDRQYIKVLAHETCRIDLSIKAYYSGYNGNAQQKLNAKSLSKNKSTKDRKELMNQHIRGLPKVKTMIKMDINELREKSTFLNEQLIKECNDMDIFLTKSHGNKFLPRYLGQTSSIVQENMFRQGACATNEHKQYTIAQRALKEKSKFENAQSQRNLILNDSLERKEQFLLRPDNIRKTRINRENDELKIIISSHWIYFIRVMHFLYILKSHVRKTHQLRLVAINQDKKIKKIQTQLKTGQLFRIMQKKKREENDLIYSSLFILTRFQKKKTKRRMNYVIRNVFKNFCRTKKILVCIQQYTQMVVLVQKTWKRHMLWKKTWYEKFDQHWEREFSNCEEWQLYRNEQLVAKNLPKDSFLVSEQLHLLSRDSMKCFTDYLLDIELLNFIDKKHDAQNKRRALKGYGVIGDGGFELIKVEPEDKTIVQNILDNPQYIFKLMANPKNIIKGGSNRQKLANIRYQASNQTTVYHTGSFEIFHTLIKKAHSVKKDFDYKNELHDKEAKDKGDLSPVSPLMSHKSPNPSSPLISRIYTQISPSKSPIKKKMTNVCRVEFPTKERDQIRKLRHENWNKNLRKIIPAQIRFGYDFDAPLLRALVYYICLNTKLGIEYTMPKVERVLPTKITRFAKKTQEEEKEEENKKRTDTLNISLNFAGNFLAKGGN